MAYHKNILLAFLFCLSTQAFSQLQITPQSNAQALAQYLVGDGIIISNITTTGSTLASGFFKNIGGTQINLDSGIALSTGRVLTNGSFIGLNGTATSFAGNTLGTPGDVDLSAAIGGSATNDAIVLEFDFIPLGDTVKFRYVFSSEEYPGFVCTSFNDVFAFFISGPGIPGGTTNLARVPGTNIPVAINSINSGIPGGSITTLPVCNAMGPGSPFPAYYTNNGSNGYFTHNGHTKVLTAISAVQPCQTYHLKIAIADVGDANYDSNVFLEAKSLKSDPIQLISANPLVNGLPYLVEGCHNGAVKVVRSRKFPYPQPVTLTYAGTAINGVDVQTLPGTAAIPANDSVLIIPITPIVDNINEGIETLKIYVSNGCVGNSNFFLDSLEIQLRDYDTLTLTPKDTMLCKNAPAQFNASGTYPTYQWTPAVGLSNPNIANPVATPPATMTYVCNAGLNNCKAQDSVRVRVKSLSVLSTTNVNCKNGSTGQIRVSGGREWAAPVQYNIGTGAYGSDSTFSNLPVGSYTVRVRDVTGCIDSLVVTLTQAFGDLQVAESKVTASCVGQNGQVSLGGSGGLAPYSFAVDNQNFSATSSYTVAGGNHIVYVTDANGCITSKPVVIDNDQPISVVLSSNAAACDGSSSATIYANASGGSTQYEYSIDGTTFQVADSFSVSTNNVTVLVRDNKGCTASQSIAIPLNQLIMVNAGPDATICEGKSFTIPTQSTAATFTWNAAPGLSGLTQMQPVASPVTTTTYYVTAVRDVCVVRDTITINVLPAPVANAGLDSSICYGKRIELNGSGGTGFQWNPVSEVSDASIFNPSVRPTKKTIFTLWVTDANGCRSLKQDTVIITLVPSIQAFAGRDTSIGINQPLQLQGMDLGNSGVTMYQWTPPFGLNNPAIANPIATLDKDMTYVLTLTTPEGCQGTDTINIKAFLGPEIYVPNAFTPDGNGQNDVLRAIPIGMKEFRYFRVYNRWGELIFSTSDPKKGWNGMIDGVRQQTGTYVWAAEAVDFRGNVVSRRGVTTVIR